MQTRTFEAKKHVRLKSVAKKKGRPTEEKTELVLLAGKRGKKWEEEKKKD